MPDPSDSSSRSCPVHLLYRRDIGWYLGIRSFGPKLSCPLFTRCSDLAARAERQTFHQLTCWVCGASPSTFEPQSARAHQINLIHVGKQALAADGERYPCRANLAHIRQSRPDFVFRRASFNPFKLLPFAVSKAFLSCSKSLKLFQGSQILALP